MMKKIINSGLVLIFLIVMQACLEDEIKIYDGVDNIYFKPSVVKYADLQDPIDSMHVSFAFNAEDVAIVKIPVSAQGMLYDFDREYNIGISDKTNAKEGINYEVIPTVQIFRANHWIDTLEVKLLRTEELKEKTLILEVELLPSKHFDTRMVEREINSITGEMLNHTKFVISFDDVLVRPKYWYDFHLGTFSKKKLLLMHEVMDLPLDKFTYKVPFPESKYIGMFMQIYLDDMQRAGTPIYEEDGILMIMGSGVAE